MKRQVWFAIAAITACGVFMGTASGATASGANDCYGTYPNFCMWHDSSYMGTMWTWNTNKNSHNTWLYVGSAANDQASSLFNERSYVTYVDIDYPASIGTQYEKCWGPNVQVANLGPYEWPGTSLTMNDDISSVDILNNETAC